MISNIMRGAWITPTGEVHYTQNIQSHRHVIQEMHIEEFLRERSRQLQWDETEMRLGLHNDLAYVALRLGYIRVLVFNDQFAVETYGEFNQMATERLKTVCLHFKDTYGMRFNNFVAEKESNHEVITECSIDRMIFRVNKTK